MQKRSEQFQQRIAKDPYFKSVYWERENLFKHPPYLLEQKLRSAIMAGDLSDALGVFREIARFPKAVLAEDPLRSLKNSLICSCSAFCRAAIAVGIAPDIAFAYSDALIQSIELFDEREALAQFEETMLVAYVQLVQHFLEQRYPTVVIQAIQYINCNLTQKLTLGEIAERVFVHPNYLSTVFRQKTGETLMNYINRKKIEEAAYYVAYSSYDVSDIANLYRFCNQAYFCTVFKKVTGQSPGAYKRSIVLQKELYLAKSP